MKYSFIRFLEKWKQRRRMCLFIHFSNRIPSRKWFISSEITRRNIDLKNIRENGHALSLSLSLNIFFLLYPEPGLRRNVQKAGPTFFFMTAQNRVP